MHAAQLLWRIISSREAAPAADDLCALDQYVQGATGAIGAQRSAKLRQAGTCRLYGCHGVVILLKAKLIDATGFAIIADLVLPQRTVCRMNRLLTGIACIMLMTAAAAAADAVNSGIDLQYVDNSVRPQDDLYRYVNGKWLDSATIPADRARYGAIDQLRDQTLDRLRAILDGLQTALNAGDADQPKLANLYASFMDEKRADKLKLKPLKPEFERIDRLQSRNDIPALVAHLNRIGITVPYTPFVHLDARDSTRYVFDIAQDGLGMPEIGRAHV